MTTISSLKISFNKISFENCPVWYQKDRKKALTNVCIPAPYNVNMKAKATWKWKRWTLTLDFLPVLFPFTHAHRYLLILYTCIFPTMQLPCSHAEWGSLARGVAHFMSQLWTLQLLVLITRNVASSSEVMIGCLHVCTSACQRERESDEWSGSHWLDVLTVNLVLCDYWWGLDSICLALSVALINTNCITSGVRPSQCALSAPTRRWIGEYWHYCCLFISEINTLIVIEYILRKSFSSCTSVAN